MARRIVIRLTARDAKDSPEILQNVADVFQQDDITIDVNDSPTLEASTPISIPEAQEAIDIAKTTLDLESQAANSGTEAPTPAEADNRVRQFLQMLGREGARAAVIAIIREFIESLG